MIIIQHSKILLNYYQDRIKEFNIEFANLQIDFNISNFDLNLIKNGIKTNIINDFIDLEKEIILSSVK